MSYVECQLAPAQVIKVALQVRKRQPMQFFYNASTFTAESLVNTVATFILQVVEQARLQYKETYLCLKVSLSEQVAQHCQPTLMTKFSDERWQRRCRFLYWY